MSWGLGANTNLSSGSMIGNGNYGGGNIGGGNVSPQPGASPATAPGASGGGIAQGFQGTAGILGFASALIAGDAAYKGAEYNAGVAVQNAALSRAQAIEMARRTRIYGRKVIGKMVAAYGASGVAISGSALDVLAESAANNELDALTIEHEGEMRGRMFEADAEMSRWRGKTERRASRLAAAGSLLTSGAKMAGGGM